MTYGCIASNGKYVVGGGFQFVCRAESFQNGLVFGWVTVAYCSYLGAYYGDYTHSESGYFAVQRAPGSVFTITSATTSQVKTATTGGSGVYITPASFARVSIVNHGIANGSVSSGTSYGGYYKVGDTITVSASGAQLIESSDGNTSSTGSLQFQVSNDVTIHCYKYSNPSITASACSVGGNVAVKYSVTNNGTAGAQNANSLSLSNVTVGNTYLITVTPQAGYKLDTVTIDGTVYSGIASSSAMTFSIIPELREKSVYAISVAASARSNVTNAIIRTIHGGNELVPVVKNTTSNTTVEQTTGTLNGVSVRKFDAYVGDGYSISYAECADENGYTFDGIKAGTDTATVDASDEVVTQDRTISFYQGTAAQVFGTKHTARSYFTQPSVAVGTSTVAYGTTSSAYLAGCRASVSTESTASVWYDSNDFAVTGTGVTGWSFIGVYAVKADGTVAGYAAQTNGVATITVYSACTLVAIFGDPSATESDVDQGNSTSGTMAGLYAWEKGATNKTAIWKSKRYVCDRPVNLSCEQIYADAYPVTAKVHLFQSPETADGRVTTLSVTSQNATRLPMRRPEKYVELEIRDNAQMTGVSVSTAMEGLWH